jgi:transcriptional regulator with XRE-family HTH domain
MTTVSQAELARRLGTTRSYITALKANGRLVFSEDGSGLDLEASLARIEATRDPQRADVAERHATARAATLTAVSVAQQETARTSHPVSDDDDANSYQAARAIKEKYAAKSARMEYERAIGKLIEKESVEIAVEDLMTAVRQSLEQLPHRVAPQLTDQPLDTVRATLKREVRDILSEMVREFSNRLKEIQQ